uniref:Uncharacterized protein n=1 Tax=Candidatus Methanophagaceae archaeon ANME-1 ERB6 TaxID=2759912 RepID=A0A7G9YWH9_9EURY|nr:hypothetical protein CJELADDK_00042 [Methanosarcinales archaeon ANME-1 ERB6]
MKLSRERKRLRREVVEVRDKIIAFGIVLVFLLSATVGMASVLSTSGGGDWKYYKEITVKEEKAG